MTKHGTERSERRSIRLADYDYARPGAYFVAVCTQNRRYLIGEVQYGVMVSNDAGRMVQAIWDEMPRWYPGIHIDGFVVMPNHIHGII